MNQLNEEIKLCKQTRNHQLEQANAVKTSIAKANPNYKKTQLPDSLSHRGQEESIKLINVINFIHDTLPSYE